ncbi:MAG: TldD/PmbA family protein [Candidatus Cloacimonetes bacterium]|nr:TldD/PmbA family protein [Candidatus Cloacimonadota bacterium]
MNHLNYLKKQLDAQPDLQYVLSSHNWSTDFLRFYHSQTNYNISKDRFSIGAKMWRGKKSYAFAIDEPDQARIDATLAEALGIIDQLSEDPDFVDLESDLTLAAPSKVPNNIEDIPLQLKTQILQELADAAQPHNFEIYGTFICNQSTSRIINSNGMDKSSTGSPIYLEVKAVHNQSQVTVLETWGGEDFSRFHLPTFKARLLEKIAHCANPVVDVDPGYYDVIFAPRCIAELAQYLAWGMSARAIDQRSSYFEGKLDTQVFPTYLSITDDPKDKDIISQDYGSDGHIYRPLKLIDKGMFKAFFCDNYYSHKTGLPKNGNTGDCLRIDAGDKSLEEMIGGVKRGLYISSLHYMNFINMKETSITGLTRDGTFLIEDGKITRVVNSLRFTDRIERIFKNILALESTASVIPFSENYDTFSISSVKAPHALVKDFNISSSTHTI